MATEQEQVLANVEAATAAWKKIKGQVGNQDNLDALLAQVGPEAYNDFIHSDSYVSVA